MKLNELFEINYGQKEYHSTEHLEKGNSLLISSKGTENGCYGFFKIKPKFNSPFITVPSTGSVGEAFVQLNDCSVDDNCLVLLPKDDYSIGFLYYIANRIRHQKWRFKYGRQITPYRLGKIEVEPLEKTHVEIDKKNIEKKAFIKLRKVICNLPDFPNPKNKVYIKNIFDVLPGGSKIGFKNYPCGNIPYVSSGHENNSVIGFVKSNNINEITIAPAIIVTAFCHANIQFWNFIGRGNGGSAIKVLKPKQKMTDGELLWYASQINSQSWRFSYGLMVSLSRLGQMLVFKSPKEMSMDFNIID